MGKKHDFTPKYTYVQAPTAAMNICQHSRCHYKWDSGSVPAGMNNLHTRRPAGRRTPSGSPPPAPTTARARRRGRSPSGGSKGGRTRLMRKVQRHGYHPGGRSLFKGDSPHLRPQPSRTESSPTRSKVLPLRHGGWAPRDMQAGPGQKKPNRRARSTQLPSGYKHSSVFTQTSG
jgi:hypothetical protein